jgi:hypothetical protein
MKFAENWYWYWYWYWYSARTESPAIIAFSEHKLATATFKVTRKVDRVTAPTDDS